MIYKVYVEGTTLKQIQEQASLKTIEKALIYTGGNKCAAARLLKTNRGTLSKFFKLFSKQKRREFRELAEKHGVRGRRL